MGTNSRPSQQLARATNWLRLVFHSIVCSSGPDACALGARCYEAKALIGRLMAPPPPHPPPSMMDWSAEAAEGRSGSGGGGAGLHSIVELLQHYVACQVRRCR
jgi:hypothetical protein